ncbi:EscT/YscT/HrcT family type III secretion system export apparatus protein [Deltaproteobacteria bacterium Smac51]|nr:EscT/YscT/HrcT family type III secretion system export apparatus protein [Deltaproteobacteria bacterium Smac51]
MEALFEYIQLERHLLAAVIGMPRIMMILTFCPFLASSIVSGQLKFTVGLSLYIIVHPTVYPLVAQNPDLTTWDMFFFAALAAKEALVGFIIAFISGAVFWAAQSAGILMDNQRGASSASLTDPLSAEESTPLGSFMFQSLVYLFFISGAFTAFLALVWQSYVVWPVALWFPGVPDDLPLFIVQITDWLMLNMLLLAGPVLAASLLTDLSLGLINRFAAQLNVYVLAMPIKSGLTMFIVLVYYGIFLREGPDLFVSIRENIEHIWRIWL